MHVVLDLGEWKSQDQQTEKRRHFHTKKWRSDSSSRAADVLTDDLSALVVHLVPGLDSPRVCRCAAF
jgi:hypothetical protein